MRQFRANPIIAQITKGTSNVLTRFFTAFEYHDGFPTLPARKNPDATKNQGTAILQSPLAPKRLATHHCQVLLSGAGVQCINTIKHAQTKLITAIRRDVSLLMLIGINSIPKLFVLFNLPSRHPQSTSPKPTTPLLASRICCTVPLYPPSLSQQ